VFEYGQAFVTFALPDATKIAATSGDAALVPP
jgi:hypothetical protein